MSVFFRLVSWLIAFATMVTMALQVPAAVGAPPSSGPRFVTVNRPGPVGKPTPGRLPPPNSYPPSPIVIRRVQTDKPYVAITVDDFYTANYAHRTAIRMLEAANSKHASITLCPAGSALLIYADKYPGQAAQIRKLFLDGSYELCNHTFFHPVMPALGATSGIGAEESEIEHGKEEIHDFFGRDPLPIFRPPFGSWNQATAQAAYVEGYPRILLWSIDSGDSEGPEKPPAQLLSDVSCVNRGDIILMHANRNSSAQALPLIIDYIRSKGLEPIGISELLSSGTPVTSSNPAEMKQPYTCRHALKIPK